MACWSQCAWCEKRVCCHSAGRIRPELECEHGRPMVCDEKCFEALRARLNEGIEWPR